jgi:hypothetical protein
MYKGREEDKLSELVGLVHLVVVFEVALVNQLLDRIRSERRSILAGGESRAWRGVDAVLFGFETEGG